LNISGEGTDAISGAPKLLFKGKSLNPLIIVGVRSMKSNVMKETNNKSPTSY